LPVKTQLEKKDLALDKQHLCLKGNRFFFHVQLYAANQQMRNGKTCLSLIIYYQHMNLLKCSFERYICTQSHYRLQQQLNTSSTRTQHALYDRPFDMLTWHYSGQLSNASHKHTYIHTSAMYKNTVYSPSFPETPQLPRDASAEEDFLCDRAAVLGT
jgi:hypothetical protein